MDRDRMQEAKDKNQDVNITYRLASKKWVVGIVSRWMEVAQYSVHLPTWVLVACTLYIRIYYHSLLTDLQFMITLHNLLALNTCFMLKTLSKHHEKIYKSTNIFTVTNGDNE
jgi:hypothetical protein